MKPGKNGTPYVLGFMLVLSVAFGAGVSFVHYATLDMLKKNETLHRNRILSGAFMLEVPNKTADGYASAVQNQLDTFTVSTRERTVQAFSHDTAGETHIGFDFISAGFWDEIRGVIVLEQDLSHVVNIRFYSQKETPGLGARIEEPFFTDRFKGKPIDWSGPIDERITFDAITGATQTSMALDRSLDRELETFRNAYRK